MQKSIQDTNRIQQLYFSAVNGKFNPSELAAVKRINTGEKLKDAIQGKFKYINDQYTAIANFQLIGGDHSQSKILEHYDLIERTLAEIESIQIALMDSYSKLQSTQIGNTEADNEFFVKYLDELDQTLDKF